MSLPFQVLFLKWLTQLCRRLLRDEVKRLIFATESTEGHGKREIRYKTSKNEGGGKEKGCFDCFLVTTVPLTFIASPSG